MSHLRRPDHKGLPLLHACTASGYWRQHSGRAFLTTAASCWGVSAADLDLLGGWRAQGGSAYVRRVRGKVSQIQSLVRLVIARGKAHCALEEAEALEDLSTLLRNRWVSEAEIDEQVEALGVYPANDSQAALLLNKVQVTSTLEKHSSDNELNGFEVEPEANSHGDQLLGESVGAPEDEELVLACDVLSGGFPSRTAQDSILPYLSEAALQEVLRQPLREQWRRLLQLLPAGFYTCYDRAKRTSDCIDCDVATEFRLLITLRQSTWARLCRPRSSTPAFADVVSRQALLGHKTLTGRAHTVPALPVIMRESCGERLVLKV